MATEKTMAFKKAAAAKPAAKKAEAPRKAAAAAKPAAKKAAPRKAAAAKSAAVAYRVFASPLAPEHFSLQEIELAVMSSK